MRGLPSLEPSFRLEILRLITVWPAKVWEWSLGHGVRVLAVSIYLSKFEQDKDVVTTEYIFQVIQHTAEHK